MAWNTRNSFLSYHSYYLRGTVAEIADLRFGARSYTYSVSLQQEKGREIALPASCGHPLRYLLEQAHELVDDAVKHQVVRVILFEGTEGFGVRVERREITGQISIDQVSPVAATAGS